MRKQRRDRRIRGRKKQMKNIPNEKTKKGNKEKKKQKTNQRKERQIKKLTLIKWEGRFAALMALVWFPWRWSGSCRRFYTLSLRREVGSSYRRLTSPFETFHNGKHERMYVNTNLETWSHDAFRVKKQGVPYILL